MENSTLEITRTSRLTWEPKTETDRVNKNGDTILEYPSKKTVFSLDFTDCTDEEILRLAADTVIIQIRKSVFCVKENVPESLTVNVHDHLSTRRVRKQKDTFVATDAKVIALAEKMNMTPEALTAWFKDQGNTSELL